jgi:hypothetical protein
MLSPFADCEAMCPFLLIAGIRRYVPEEAIIAVRQIELQKQKPSLQSGSSAEDLYALQRDIGRLALYTIEMGGSVELLVTALGVQPWAPPRILSRDELRRMRISTVDILVEELDWSYRPRRLQTFSVMPSEESVEPNGER